MKKASNGANLSKCVNSGFYWGFMEPWKIFVEYPGSAVSMFAGGNLSRCDVTFFDCCVCVVRITMQQTKRRWTLLQYRAPMASTCMSNVRLQAR